MTCFPSLEEFRAAAPKGRLVPVARRLMSDAFTPVTAFSRLDDGVSACLFESVVGGEKVGGEKGNRRSQPGRIRNRDQVADSRRLELNTVTAAAV